MTRFKLPSDSLTKSQRSVVNGLGKSTPKPADAVPHRLIESPMRVDTYKPPKWSAPIR